MGSGEYQMRKSELLDVAQFVEFGSRQEILANPIDSERAMNRVVDHPHAQSSPVGEPSAL